MTEPGKPCVVRVYHSEYELGGHRGHIVEIDDGEDIDQSFEFAHPDKNEDRRRWARDLARKVVAEEWPKCYDYVDWDSLEYGEIENE